MDPTTSRASAEPIRTLEQAHGALAEVFAQARVGVAFTGAGISTECGVPDFRSPGSPWLRHAPIDFAAFQASAAVRAEAWRRKFAIDDEHAGARPGRGHRALTALVAAGRLAGVITQNIDGLHQASGLAEAHVVELHGNGTYAACLGCAKRYELATLRPGFEATGTAPECACGAPIKSATVAFGQRLPERAMRRARILVEECDLCVAIGTSLVVHPAAGLPRRARERGAKLVIVNREPTPLDSIADVLIRGEIGDVLAPWDPERNSFV